MKENSYNENELVYMVRQGDERSLQLLLELYRPRIRSIIRKNCTYQLQLRHQEKDLQQIAAQALFRAVFDYREHHGIRFSTFAANVIRNALIDYQRAQYRRAFYLPPHLLALDAPVGGNRYGTLADQLPNPRIEENGSYQIYLSALKQQESMLKKHLSSVEYEIYRLRNLGYTYPQIAERVKVNRKKVENTLRKIRRMMEKTKR